MTIPETNKFPFIYFGNRPVFVFMTRNTQVPQKKFFAGLLMGAKKSLCCGTSLGHSTILDTVIWLTTYDWIMAVKHARAMM